jgi:hypothetical protein
MRKDPRPKKLKKSIKYYYRYNNPRFPFCSDRRRCRFHFPEIPFQTEFITDVSRTSIPNKVYYGCLTGDLFQLDFLLTTKQVKNWRVRYHLHREILWLSLVEFRFSAVKSAYSPQKLVWWRWRFGQKKIILNCWIELYSDCCIYSNTSSMPLLLWLIIFPT